MEQIVDYLNFGQEKAQFPDREAKLIRNHPFMTQLDFFDMQEDQEMKWEDETRHRQAVRVSQTFGMSAAAVRAMAPRTGSTRTADGASQTDGTQSNSAGTQTANDRPRLNGKQSGGTQTEMSTGSKDTPVYIPQHVPIYSQHPVYTVHNNTSTSGSNPSMQKGVSYRPPPPSGPPPPQYGQGPHSQQPP